MDTDRETTANLSELRHLIDEVDAAMVELLAERFRYTLTIGKLKARHGLASRDLERETAQSYRLRNLAARSGLDVDFALKLHAFIIQEVVRNHEALARRN
jgi:chorismate mutase